MIDENSSHDTIKRLKFLIYNFCHLESGTLRTDINLRQYGIESGEVVTNIVLQELCSVHPNILRLDLTNCSEITDVGIWSISKHCVNLTHLILHGCKNVSNVGFRSLSLKCADLITLDLTNCVKVDDVTLTVIASGCWHIQNIGLRGCNSITDSGVARLARLGDCLKILDLRGCNNIGEFGDRALRELGAYCVNLKELYFSDSKRIEDGGLIALVQGCTKIEVLMIAGCRNISRKSLKAIGKYCKSLQKLRMINCLKLCDEDWQVLDDPGMLQSLTSIDLVQWSKLTDNGVAAICQALGSSLINISISNNSNITDYSSIIISNLCLQLRSLDLSHCPRISDETIHSVARKLLNITALKLDGNPKITTRALIIHVNKELEFVDMATQWLGYQPKPNSEKLIKEKLMWTRETEKAIKIQSVIRRKFAHRMYWERYQSRLLLVAVPYFQAIVRGYLQRRRYTLLKLRVLQIRNIIKIQCIFRRFSAKKKKKMILKKQHYQRFVNSLALIIQRLYRGHRDRLRTKEIRNSLANDRLVQAQRRARREMSANLIQRIYRGHLGRRKAQALDVKRRRKEESQRIEDIKSRMIQRVVRGLFGRNRANNRREELEWNRRQWLEARNIQRIFRGMQGRIRFAHFYQKRFEERRRFAAIQIQRTFRGYRGMLLGAVARALRALRIRQHHYAAEMQRFVRGCIGRMHFAHHKEIVTRHRRHTAAAIQIQRIFRGHKGREAKLIEKELQIMESKANPLIIHLKQLEEKLIDINKLIHRLEFEVNRIGDDLSDIEQELDHCEKTTNQYTDSSRINNTPQRFLTNFLKIRLKDFLIHQTELHRVKFIDLQKRRAIRRDLERDVSLAKRELIPLTTGLIVQVKKQRAKDLREKMLQRKRNAIRIQSLWRRALVRMAYYDEHKEYWIQDVDKHESDDPFYYNIVSHEKVWTKPLAYRYFGDRYLQEYKERTAF